jgi:putative flippase GtrA
MRYAITGLVANAVLYAIYLLLRHSGTGTKAAMTLVYCAGGLATFVFNRRWAFGHDGAVSPALLRYAVTYVLVYFFNMAALAFFVDRVGYPHQAVVLALIFVSAGITFLLHKFWVFPAAPTAAATQRLPGSA